MTRIGAVCLITIGFWVVIEIVVGFVRWKHTCYAGVGERPCLCALRKSPLPVLFPSSIACLSHKLHQLPPCCLRRQPQAAVSCCMHRTKHACLNPTACCMLTEHAASHLISQPTAHRLSLPLRLPQSNPACHQLLSHQAQA